MLLSHEQPLWQLVTAITPDPEYLSTPTAKSIATRQAWHELETLARTLLVSFYPSKPLLPSSPAILRLFLKNNLLYDNSTPDTSVAQMPILSIARQIKLLPDKKVANPIAEELERQHVR